MPTTIELIPCIRCGNPRPIRGSVPVVFRRAANRPCLKCSNRGLFPLRRWPADIDDLVVQHLVDGRPVNATPAERRAAVVILTARKLSAREIALRINCTPRTVVRHRAKAAA
jgi:hypothetical protein